MNKITGYTGLYGIVANPIKHSFSPMMHNTAFQYLGRPLIPSALHRSSPPLWGAPLPGAATAAWASLSLPRMDAF